MSPVLPASLVLDASLALSWCFEDKNVAADRLLDLVVEHGAVVPAIWRLEVANALQMAVRQGRIAAAYRDRALAEEARAVGELGAAIVRVLQAEGVAACGKHFPGHGDTSTDSHHELPLIEHPPEQLRDREFLPFRAAIPGSQIIQIAADNAAAIRGVIIIRYQHLGSSGIPLEERFITLPDVERPRESAELIRKTLAPQLEVLRLN